ncbi:MAG: hypothetical protein J3R72DRAFT_188984 [Linnemannia gamsii]|nr:MAG: hypothetical protein J3R72DRAFT_188984 [Linnemannia gamsii]
MAHLCSLFDCLFVVCGTAGLLRLLLLSIESSTEEMVVLPLKMKRSFKRMRRRAWPHKIRRYSHRVAAAVVVL